MPLRNHDDYAFVRMELLRMFRVPSTHAVSTALFPRNSKKPPRGPAYRAEPQKGFNKRRTEFVFDNNTLSIRDRYLTDKWSKKWSSHWFSQSKYWVTFARRMNKFLELVVIYDRLNLVCAHKFRHILSLYLRGRGKMAATLLKQLIIRFSYVRGSTPTSHVAR